ncbi:MAG: PQQ-binding-like beta-propeller repeat protein [Candidatus Acidiferrales bacterium]
MRWKKASGLNDVVLTGTLFVATLVSLPLAALAQSGTKDSEWPTYAADLAGTRYRPLGQIDAGNFNKLEIAWTFKTDNLGTRPEYKLEGTPLMIGGVLYATAGTRRSVVALDAATGELLWVHGEHEGARGAAAPRQLSGRGLAYWASGAEERIIYVTPGYRLVALDAKTGVPVPGFGENGVVDLKHGVVFGSNQQIDLITGEIGLNATPIVTKDVVIVGSAMREGGTPKTHNNSKGLVRGYDARTGKLLWTFNTIPKPGEFGNDTWLNDSWAINGNTGVWTQISVDEELGLAYLPVEEPTGDYYGGYRPGNNLFGDSLVAVDVRTGRVKWHFQLVHHELWDMDISSAPILGDATVNGRTIKVVAQPTKQGILYVFDRATGQPVWSFEERTAPSGDVPGEWYSPTQPIPTKPPAYSRNGVSVADLIDFTPALRAEAMEAVSKYKLGPIFTPPVLSKIDGPLATLTLGTAAGATSWPGGSYDPETHIVYVQACNACLVPLGLVPSPSPEFSDMRYVQGTAGQEVRMRTGPGENVGADAPPPAAPPASGAAVNGLTVQGLPLIKPPYGTISAISLDTGEILWQVAHGETPDAVRSSPTLKGMDIPRTGQTGHVGTLVTKTLVIAGDPQTTRTDSHPRGAMLRAYDKATGNEVGAVYMPAPQSGSPMTYMLNGKQYIVVAVSGGSYSGEYLAFTLPK